MSQISKHDPFYKLKFMGYCLAQLSPEGVPSTFEDFLNYAKFQLSLDKHVLMEDPIWDRYTDEAILVEFFGNLFSKSKEKRMEFEATFIGAVSTLDDFNAWADRQIEKNQKDLEKAAMGLEDNISFNPKSLGE